MTEFSFPDASFPDSTALESFQGEGVFESLRRVDFFFASLFKRSVTGVLGTLAGWS